MRATSMPLRISSRRISSSSVAGPSVQMILVFLIVSSSFAVFFSYHTTKKAVRARGNFILMNLLKKASTDGLILCKLLKKILVRNSQIKGNTIV